MKNTAILFFLFSIIATGFIFQSCVDEQPSYIAFDAYEYASLDANGGSWHPKLLSSGSQIGIPAPYDITSAEYQAELAALKAASAQLTGEQEEAVKYWGGDGLIRWNEIARELAAKYNLAPSPDSAGNYPAPNSADPGKYPLFPFAHPPYSCRAFAYWAATEYDALISTWYHKYNFNRPAPYTTDATIVTHLPKNNLPSYPADGAVIAAVSKAALTALFPLEKDFLAAKALEHENSLMWAGLNVQSDITAGDSLGRAVWNVVKVRAGSDGLKNAQTPRPKSDSIRDDAQARLGWHWENKETPPRPVGITPLFGKVKLWNVPDVITVRPDTPPAPGSPAFEVAANELKDISDNLTTDQRRIANFWSDGLGTYTPPGHWNRFASDLIVEHKLNPLRAARVLAYLNMAMADAGISCWDAKYFYHYPRPIQAIPGFKTILGTPNFPSYTSGHSTFSYAGATVLSHFFPDETGKLTAYAQEASESRIYAGIHYRFDVEAGKQQGISVGNFSVDVARADGGE
ncbi:MAG TPA: phosphatase PAP2 family protein [Saprospiraceae bacterium]|nr:phosphatase PAP2 family protein [Saprospiraceae bacterium]